MAGVLILGAMKLCCDAGTGGWYGRWLALVACLWLPLASASTNSPAPPLVAEEDTADLLIPMLLPDPLEPFNRGVWVFNRGLMSGLIRPTAVGYRFIVRKPLRIGIRNFGRNIAFPGRLLNNLLQGRWAGARDETYRFGANTVLGLGGFFDLASQWGIPPSEADFGQTLGTWGWRPQAYIMLPIFGPSNERDVVGMAADTAANPLTYISPYSSQSGKPFTYVSPYTYAFYAITYNNLSDSVEDVLRFARSEMDPYSKIEYVWGFVRDARPVQAASQGPLDVASLQTLQSVFFTVRNASFIRRGKTGSVRVSATGKKLPFSYWMQPNPAPVVYIVPGLGSHRLADAALALAELVFENGFSPVIVSSSFNFEFMERASTAPVPAYPPADVHDLQVALRQIDDRLESKYPGRKRGRALLGYSMGAFQSLYLAAQSATEPTLHFDRIVAINPPVRLLYGTSKLDEYFQAPLDWPREERTERIRQTLLKSAGLTQGASQPPVSLSFSGTESKFLVGLSFRLLLRDAIFNSQFRTNQGILRHPLRSNRRQPAYREILQYSFGDYFERFVLPWYARGKTQNAEAALTAAADLRTFSAQLRSDPSVRVIGTRNDFLLSPDDLGWLQSTFGPDRLTLAEEGGHLGNLLDAKTHEAIVAALQGARIVPADRD